MSEIRKQGRSSKARRNRTIRIAPMTRAVRSALATSTLVLALGAAGNASAADHALSRAQVQLLRFEQATLDTAPVFDLTTVPQGLIGPGAPVQSLIGGGSDPLDIGSGGTFDASSWTNDATPTDVSSATNNAHALHVISTVGNLSGTNTYAVSAYSGGGHAVVIYTSAATTNYLNNSGALTANGYTDAAGIASFGVDDVTVVNSGTLYATAYLGNAYGVLGVSDTGDVVIDNDADIDAVSFGG